MITWANRGNDTSLFSRTFSWAPVRKRDKLPDTFAWSNKIVYARNVNGDRRIYTARLSVNITKVITCML